MTASVDASDAPAGPDNMWEDNLREWILDEGAVVSAKSLSRTLKVHANVAKEMLFKFADENADKEDLEVVYLVANGRRGVRLVRRDDVAKAETDLGSVSSKHVFAVGRKSALKNGLALCWRQMDAVTEAPNASNLSAVQNKRAVPNRASEAVTR